jgi:hypothetical protein
MVTVMLVVKSSYSIEKTAWLFSFLDSQRALGTYFQMNICIWNAVCWRSMRCKPVIKKTEVFTTKYVEHLALELSDSSWWLTCWDGCSMLSLKYCIFRARNMAQMVELLPSIYMGLEFKPWYCQKKRKKYTLHFQK